MNPLTVMIADDHQLIRNTWHTIIARDARFTVVAQCSSGEEAILAAKNLRPDIALIDINMTPVNGFEATTGIRRLSPLTRVVAVSMFAQVAYVRKMFRLGALGYVSKNSSYTELISAMLTVAEGRRFVCEEIQSLLTDLVMEEDNNSVNRLTPRELEVMKFIKEGLSSKEMAARMHVSMKTIEVHRHRILKKVNVHNTAQLVNYMNNAGLDI